MGGNRRMAIFTLSAFADEYSPIFDEQIKGLRANGMHLIELRGIDEVNISDLSDEKAREVKAKLDVAGIGISALGSPIGKIALDGDFEAHLDAFKRILENADIGVFYRGDRNEEEQIAKQAELLRTLGGVVHLIENPVTQISSTVEKYPMEVDYSAIVLGFLDLAN